MEALILLLLAVPTLGVVGFGLAIRALARARQLERRVEQLEASLRGATVPAAAPVAEPPAPPRLADLDTEELEIPEELLAPPAAAPAPAEAVQPTPRAEGPEVHPVAEPAPAAARPPAAPRPRIEWERWIGVRGAAAAGGVVLALASLLFFKYSIEQGLISPAMRVVLGLLAGIGCLIGSEWLRPRRQKAAADALAGGGIVVLYAALWAAHHLYGLVGAPAAFGAMALVTITCGLLAHRRQSLLVAVLGLVGGFATPLMVAVAEDQPASLFSYVLLLDGGLLWLARQRRWPALAILALAGTAIHQGLWIFEQMDPARALIGLAVLGVFALLFPVLGRTADDATTPAPLWRLTRVGAVLLPFAFALSFAGRTDLGPHPLPVTLLLALLSGCACWLARTAAHRLLAPAAAAAAVAVLAVWFASHPATGALAWEAVGCALAVAVVFAIATEVDARTHRPTPVAVAELLAAAGLLGVTALAATADAVDTAWPWLIGWLGLAAAVVHAARRSERWASQLVAGLGVGFAWLLLNAVHGGADPLLARTTLLILTLALAVLAQLLPLLSTPGPARRWAEHTAAATAVFLMLPAVRHLEHVREAPGGLLVSLSLLGLLAVLAATRLASGGWYLASVLATAGGHALWAATARSAELEPEGLLVGLAVGAVTAAAAVAWPLAAGPALTGRRSTWWGTGLAAALWFPILGALWEGRFGDGVIAVVPLSLAVVTLAVALATRRLAAVHASAQVWLLAVTLSLVSVAIPLQLERQWITIGWAVNGLALIALWRRLDHPGLKYFGAALLAAATVRLVANPSVLGYAPRGATPVLNWVLYTYLVPAAALLLSGRMLTPLEGVRLRPFELEVLQRPRAPLAGACGLGAIVVVFAWINLAIADLFGTGSHLELSLERLPARDVATSISWAAYALVLLAVGIRGERVALRWISLALMVVTLGKVFLHDLGELEDLYRVASLLGLAVSLIVVSLIYQRWVLRRPPPEEP